MFAILDGALPLWHRAFLGTRIYVYDTRTLVHAICPIGKCARARARGRRVHTVHECVHRPHTGAHPSCDMRKLIVCPGIDALENQNPERPTIDLLLYPHERAVVSCSRTFIHSDCDVREFAMRSLVLRLRASLHTHIDFDLAIKARVFSRGVFSVVIFIIFHACVEAISKFRNRNFSLLFSTSTLSRLWILKNFDHFYRFYLYNN